MREGCSHRTGFSLMECLLSICIVTLLLPCGLAALLMMKQQQVKAEIGHMGGDVVELMCTLVQEGAGDSGYHFTAEGELVGVLHSPNEAIPGDTGYIVIVEREDLGHHAQRVQMEVTAPAGRAREHRMSSVYTIVTGRDVK